MSTEDFDGKLEKEFLNEKCDFLDEPKKKVLTDEEKECIKKKEVGVYIRYAFLFFMIIWTFMIAINKFYVFSAFPVLILPYASFGLGMINSDDIADDDIEDGVLSTTFITMGLIISLPLLTYMNKDSQNKELNHIIFLAMISTLLSYIHIWVDKNERHVCKIIRSCLETIAVTLYIFALTIFFILP